MSRVVAANVEEQPENLHFYILLGRTPVVVPSQLRVLHIRPLSSMMRINRTRIDTKCADPHNLIQLLEFDWHCNQP